VAINHAKTAIVRQKLGRELREYAVVATYLYLCFSALIFYKLALLQSEGMPYSHFGIAAIKALILGKFILLGHALHLGQSHNERRLIHVIAVKSLLYLLLLIAFSVVEEGILALVHGKTIQAAFIELWGGKLWQILASSILMLLVLVPYLAFREINEGTNGKLWSFVLRARVRA
jgi:hypothetical protein